MNTGFQITSEGYVFVRNNGPIYRDTLINFAADNGSPVLALPQGVTDELYEPGVRHAYATAGVGVVGGGDMPWAWGDDVISRCSALLTAQAARVAAANPPPPPPPTPDVGTVSPSLVAAALQINVSNGDIPSMTGVFNIGAAVYLGVGNYMLFFMTPLADTNYFPVLQDGSHDFGIVEQTTDYLTVQATTAGVAADVSQFSLQIFKF